MLVVNVTELAAVRTEGDSAVYLQVQLALDPDDRWEYRTARGNRVVGSTDNVFLDIYRLSTTDEAALDLSWGVYTHATKFKINQPLSDHDGYVGYLRFILKHEFLSHKQKLGGH